MAFMMIRLLVVVVILLCIALMVTLIQGCQKNDALSTANKAVGRATVALSKSTMALGSIPKVEYNACHRLNIQRASNNRNSYADYNSDLATYKFDELEINLVRASLRQQTGSLPRTAEQRRATKLFINGLQSAAAGVQAAARAKEWTALTDCVLATGNPGYQAPQPVHFAKQAPPYSDLVLGPRN
jgi:hypothetical protein